MKDKNMDKYLKAIKENVCSICADSDEKGICTLHKNETCAVEYYYPQILQIVKSSESDDLAEIKAELHEAICINCRATDNEGNCYLREDANCSLDRYFPIIVETIRKVDDNLI